MSYNIDTFKIKKLSNLVIKVSDLYKGRKDWWPERVEHPKVEGNDFSRTTFKVGSCYVSGRTVNNELGVEEYLVVEALEFSEECSGMAMNEMLEPALAESKGELVVSMVWEGGDSINKLVVKDGVISWVDIEI